MFENSFLSFLVRCLLATGLLATRVIAPKIEHSPPQSNPKYHGADNTTSVLIEIIKLCIAKMPQKKTEEIKKQ